MELYVPREAAQNIISVANKYNIDAQVIGHAEKHAEKKLTIKSKHGEFQY
jgi:phosphoribosylformylglycinamidine cyclo-ligase